MRGAECAPLCTGMVIHAELSRECLDMCHLSPA